METNDTMQLLLALKSQVEALEKRLNDMELLMKRPGHEEYEKLVDVVLEHDKDLHDPVYLHDMQDKYFDCVAACDPNAQEESCETVCKPILETHD